jgi:hypothetical protein
MTGLKQLTFASLIAASLACAPLAPAAAHGFGRGGHGWGFGRGLFGVAAAIVTLPVVIASAAISGVGAILPPEQPAYASPPSYGGSYAPGYYPSPGYYAAPPYYAAPARYPPPTAYYPRAVYPAAPGYYRGYYAPRPGYYGGYAFRGYGRPAYPAPAR